MVLESEKNRLAISGVLAADHTRIYNELKSKVCSDLVVLKDTEDYWCRDYMPLQVEKGTFLQFKYEPDYLGRNPKNHEYITDPYKPLSHIEPASCIKPLDLILDGGNVVFAINKDGKKVAIMTEKIFYENANEERGKDEAIKEIVDKLEKHFGCELLLLPWDIWDVCGHIDGIVHPISKGQLLVNVRLYEPYIANEMRRRLSKQFNLIELPLSEYHDLSWAYINMVRTKDFICVPQMKLKTTDKEALDFIKLLYPQYGDRIIPIDTRYLSEKYGGSLNCMTWTYKE